MFIVRNFRQLQRPRYRARRPKEAARRRGASALPGWGNSGGSQVHAVSALLLSRPARRDVSSLPRPPSSRPAGSCGRVAQRSVEARERGRGVEKHQRAPTGRSSRAAVSRSQRAVSRRCVCFLRLLSSSRFGATVARLSAGTRAPGVLNLCATGSRTHSRRGCKTASELVPGTHLRVLASERLARADHSASPPWSLQKAQNRAWKLSLVGLLVPASCPIEPGLFDALVSGLLFALFADLGSVARTAGQRHSV